jgi:hypothetical protein
MWHVYYRNGSFLIPVVAKRDAGFFLDIGPVAVVPRGEPSGLVDALSTVAAAGNPRIPTPSRDAYPPPAVLMPAGVKTWKTFEKKSICWTVTTDGKGVFGGRDRTRPRWGVDRPAEPNQDLA